MHHWQRKAEINRWLSDSDRPSSATMFGMPSHSFYYTHINVDCAVDCEEERLEVNLQWLRCRIPPRLDLVIADQPWLIRFPPFSPFFFVVSVPFAIFSIKVAGHNSRVQQQSHPHKSVQNEIENAIDVFRGVVQKDLFTLGRLLFFPSPLFPYSCRSVNHRDCCSHKRECRCCWPSDRNRVIAVFFFTGKGKKKVPGDSINKRNSTYLATKRCQIQ